MGGDWAASWQACARCCDHLEAFSIDAKNRCGLSSCGRFMAVASFIWGPAGSIGRVREVVHAERRRLAPRDDSLLSSRPGNSPWVEGLLWIAVLALLSPLLIYYRPGVMPLAALFGIAGGIALGLALVGRWLHRSLVSDALTGRGGKGRFLMTFGMALLLLFLVLLGCVVALIFVLRQVSPSLPV
jgi:hypothetical protein